MGKSEPTLKSDSGYGDDVSETAHDGSDTHPLILKGYDIGPASRLQVGDVFEFLWADSAEFEWEWKCLGYNRFIVLRHSDTFPHYCVCIPVCSGSKHEFAKPGIDSFQQGFLFANGEPNPGYEQPNGGHKLPYSAVGVELRRGKLRIREDSRANYADIVEVDHDAQVMVIGDVARYFDRVRRNVNKAFMRQILRKALEEYQAGRTGEDQQLQMSEENPASQAAGAAAIAARPDSPMEEEPVVVAATKKEEEVGAQVAKTDDEKRKTTTAAATATRRDQEVPKEKHKEERAQTKQATRRPSKTHTSDLQVGGKSEVDYDLRSMHNVAMAGLK